MHAVLVAVDIVPGRYEESLRSLDEYIIPMCKSAPGYIRGTWFGNQESGNSLMVFDSEESARQFAALLRDCTFQTCPVGVAIVSQKVRLARSWLCRVKAITERRSSSCT
jgi:hypothetical protein